MKSDWPVCNIWWWQHPVDVHCYFQPCRWPPAASSVACDSPPPASSPGPLWELRTWWCRFYQTPQSESESTNRLLIWSSSAQHDSIKNSGPSLTLCAISNGSPPLMRIPFWAPTPVPTITAVGVARPREQGQAMQRTVMEAWKAKRMTASASEMLLS